MKELAKTILDDGRLDAVLRMARETFRSKGTDFNAGSNYPETWIRDFATFLEFALEVVPRDALRERLMLFLDFQGEDGSIVDAFVPRDYAREHPNHYDYIYSAAAPDYKAHRNSVESDHESSLVLAVSRYIEATGEWGLLSEVRNGKTVRERCAMALDYVCREMMDDHYGLVKGATTIDWTDVQPEHHWGVCIDENTHWCVDIYNNAIYIMAIDAWLEWLDIGDPKHREWSRLAGSLRANARKHLWDVERQKFIPHRYLGESPFADIPDFNEDEIHYFGGTVSAIFAGVLEPPEVREAFGKMIEIKKASGAMTFAVINYPPYPAGSFQNPDAQPYTYVNAADWTWWGARGLEAMIKTGHLELAYQEIAPFLDRAIKNGGFFEWYSVKDHKPHGSHTFLGAAGALGKTILLMQSEARRILQHPHRS
jgi:hypothetical protein